MIKHIANIQVTEYQLFPGHLPLPIGWTVASVDKRYNSVWIYRYVQECVLCGKLLTRDGAYPPGTEVIESSNGVGFARAQEVTDELGRFDGEDVPYEACK